MMGFDGDEFIIESYGISWLLWINLLVMFLLIFVLYYFTVFVSDGVVTSEVGQISSAKKYGGQLEFMESKINYCSNKISSSSCSKDIKVYSNKIIMDKGNASTSRREIRERRENQDQIDEVKGYPATTHYNQCSSYNPCYLLELGKKAFLKCLGLDSTTNQDSSAVQQPSSLSSGNKVQEKRNETDKSK